MNLTTTPISDLIILEPRIFEDDRGFFFESFNQDWFSQNVAKVNFVQDNQSFSVQNVIRGLHFQKGEMAQAKLVRVLDGKIYDVAVDIRPHSPTFGKYFGVELSSDNQKQLYIPRGFAHGFSVLTQSAIMAYKCDNFWSKEAEGGIKFNDQDLQIDWQIDKTLAIVSQKDLGLGGLEEVGG